jgi:hypothetical protein
MTRDDKLQAASVASGQPFDRVFWLWSALLEDAAERDSDGYFLVSLSGLARQLGCDTSELLTIAAALDQAGRIGFDLTGNGAAAGTAEITGQIAAWKKRQFASDNSTARVRRWRAMKRATKAK